MEKLDPSIPVAVPQNQIPQYRTTLAIQRGVERNLLLKSWGGKGDMMCAEPTFRYAFKYFKDCEISLASEEPGLYKHLPFKRVFDTREEFPNEANYLVFETIVNQTENNLSCHFLSHMLTNCVDFPSLNAFRLQLPVEDREIVLSSDEPTKLGEQIKDWIRVGVLVHPGRHWQTKTFPREFWEGVTKRLIELGETPILIGGDADDNRGTIEMDTTGCVDIRGLTTIPELVWCCQSARVVLTNDSVPLHAAASGKAWIGFVATAKHPDLITHWRKGQWQWREKNFGRGGIWDLVDFCPNKKQNFSAEYVDPEILKTWLPNPEEMAVWAVRKANEEYCD